MLCEADEAPLLAYKVDLTTLLAAVTVTKFQNHPLNSVSACSAYCAPSLFIVYNTVCACINSFDSTSHSVINECVQTLPCPGNVLQICGCTEAFDSKSIIQPVFYPVIQGFQNSPPGRYECITFLSLSYCVCVTGYESCEDLRGNGIFIDGAYELISGRQECKLWGN